MFGIFKKRAERKALVAEAHRLASGLGEQVKATLEDIFSNLQEIPDELLAGLKIELEVLEETGIDKRDPAEGAMIEMVEDYDQNIAPQFMPAILQRLESEGHLEFLELMEMTALTMENIRERLAAFRFNMVAQAVIIVGKFCERLGLPDHPNDANND